MTETVGLQTACKISRKSQRYGKTAPEKHRTEWTITDRILRTSLPDRIDAVMKVSRGVTEHMAGGKKP